MTEVELRGMQQNASDLVRRAQNGEHVIITIAGRPAAVLGPVTSGTWRRWEELADVFTQPTARDWTHDRQLIDDSLVDP